ncbi:hypothetical protein [Actinomadura sp. KC216]|nr:hypothetical protein [Actinomadura sp. KC216]
MADNDPMPPVPRGDAQATEADEDLVLERLYGPPDRDGAFRGES